MKTSLLIAAHGSPLPEANSDLELIAADVRSRAVFDLVEVCYLECNDPSIPHAIEMSVLSGIDQITVVPYFLHAGRHVVMDLPALLEEAMNHYPKVEFRLADHLGRSPMVTEVIQSRAKAALAL